jgi:hypothetical protein
MIAAATSRLCLGGSTEVRAAADAAPASAPTTAPVPMNPNTRLACSTDHDSPMTSQHWKVASVPNRPTHTEST